MIATDRLLLIPATTDMLRAALGGRAALAAAIGARVPDTWPPRFVDHQAIEFVINRLRESPAQGAWWLYFVILREDATDRTVIGTAGYKGPASADGMVEIGYGIVRDRQRRGYASEAARALVKNAFGVPEVRRVIAETLPELTPSIGVLRKCGFSLMGEGSEPGVIRFVMTREAFETGASGGGSGAARR